MSCFDADDGVDRLPFSGDSRQIVIDQIFAQRGEVPEVVSASVLPTKLSRNIPAAS
jgi:hypothetical protein